MLKNALFLILIAIAIAGCARKVNFKTIDNHYLALLHNTERVNRNILPLQLDDYLCGIAQAHADRMAEENNLYHQNIERVGVLGENIAWGQTSEIKVVQDWMESPGHRSNILYKGFKRIGVGYNSDYWCVVFHR